MKAFVRIIKSELFTMALFGIGMNYLGTRGVTSWDIVKEAGRLSKAVVVEGYTLAMGDGCMSDIDYQAHLALCEILLYTVGGFMSMCGIAYLWDKVKVHGTGHISSGHYVDWHGKGLGEMTNSPGQLSAGNYRGMGMYPGDTHRPYMRTAWHLIF